MNSFLHIVAQDLYQTLHGNFKGVTIIFPNKRANLFFNRHLAELADGPIWTPAYTTISELFASLSRRNIADPILLICYLYKAFIKVTGSDEPLDKFYSWGEMMLSDFEDIDNNLAHADKLFENIENLEEMTDFEFLQPEQIESIRRFFTNFNPQSTTKLKEKFLHIWNVLNDIYKEFRHQLAEQNYAYEGMMKREVVEMLTAQGNAEGGTLKESNLLRSHTYVVVGFNVLNETEKALFRYLREEKRTLFYWDYDESYTGIADGRASRTVYEAGQFILENIRMFGNKLDGKDCYRNFKTPKKICFIASPTENAQTRYVTDWLQQTLNPNEPLNETAIVLCNENILQPVLHSIPPTFAECGKGNGGNKKEILLNVTMGYPMSETPVSSYIHALLDLQTHGKAGRGIWKYTQTANILKHPYTLRMAGEETITLLKELKQNNVIFPKETLFENNEFLKNVFTEQRSNRELLDYLARIIKSVGMSYKKEDNSHFLIQLYVESLFNAYSMLNRLSIIHETGLFAVQPDTLSRLLRQIINEKSIPFHGEPAIGLQVMGLLETRNLDFKNLVMLSVNEGQLPKSDRRASFIPYSLREAHGMTTMEKQNSLYAYYFYRLIQRAENISLVYNNTYDGLNKGEMSRFMMQMLVESDKLMLPNQKIALKSLYAANESAGIKNFCVRKSDAVMDMLRQRFDLDREEEYKRRHNGKGMLLTPSAINCYINCGLQFYFKYVAGMRIDEDVTEEVDNAMFGTIFHACMEKIYGANTGRTLQGDTLREWAKDTEMIGRLVDEAFAKEFFKIKPDKDNQTPTFYKPRYNGEQLLNRHVIISYVRNQLNYDAQLCPLTILGVETERYMEIRTDAAYPVRIRIGGIIDRYDRITTENGNTQLRIVDYKTSSNVQKAKSIGDLFDSSSPNRAYHILQAFYYSDVMTDTEHSPIAPSLMYVKQAKKNSEVMVRIGDETITDFATQCKQEYHKLLEDIVSEIFNPDKPFTQDLTEKHCEFCDFKAFCEKQTK
ncbi:MAG: PD-(D/E)XK nuclease family protein [Bacteroides sp.]|nr:PD-(D/E)XK nuclease family protein [Roseburia sp.]MCM1347696.1 PD-(D/E)XK nuclease family protein [Bacteroides sp.]MCM1422117.1 PD-(D/E)XK nuclease family protein [Bacteroides sp.]